jgi:regulatory protein
MTRKITGLKERPRKPGRYRLEVDGKSVATVDVSLVAELGLKPGTEYTDELDARVQHSAAKLETIDRALNALSTRSRSTKELERWLIGKQLPKEHIPGALERLTEMGLLNDFDFARGFARSRAVNRGQSRRRIEAELSKRGVHRTTISQAIADVFEHEEIDERAQVNAAAEKKLKSLSKLEPEVIRRRLHGYLARQGFNSQLIGEFMRAMARR